MVETNKAKETLALDRTSEHSRARTTHLDAAHTQQPSRSYDILTP